MPRHHARWRGRSLRLQLDWADLATTGLVWLAVAGLVVWAILWTIHPPY